MIKIYKESHVFDPVLHGQFDTKITVIDKDTLAAAKEYNNPCCLNFASHKRPGGGYKSVQDLPMPIKTQEEDLFRRSNLPDMLDNKEIRQHYPLMGVKGIYCNNVQVDRNEKLQPHDPYYISLITVPAVVNPGLKNVLVAAKVQRILEIGAAERQEVLILGAWGCGVFNNDPQEIATLFKSYLENEFSSVFQEVVFAIPRGQRPGGTGRENPNYGIFESILT